MQDDRLLTPAEIAAYFGVSPRTVTKWGREGKLIGIRTPGGTWRFHESAVRELVNAGAA